MDNNLQEKEGLWEQNELQEQSELIKVRHEKLEHLKEQGQDPFFQTVFERTHSNSEIIQNFESLEGKTAKIAGRLLLKRGMGKASFGDIHDQTGKLQIYVRADALGKEQYDDFKKTDIGDILGVTGEIFRTAKGEISIKATEVTLLAKSLRPLPEKWHGLRDTDLRYIQRYVDLIVNPTVKEVFVKRSKIISEIRSFLDNKDFLEVDTPMLNIIPGGAAARPFITHHNTLDLEMYLRIATELHLKRLIVGGFERVYEMGRIFRNEGMSIKHNPEFTTIEVYQAYTDYKGMMELTQDLIQEVAQKVLGCKDITYQGQSISLAAPFEALTMLESIEKYAELEASNLDKSQLLKFMEDKGLKADQKLSRGELINSIFEEFVEPNLTQPTFITEYPVEVSPLAKRIKNNPEFCERFELFICGREIANAFSELNDPIDQKARFIEQAKKREAGDLEANMTDGDFVCALEHGMPPTGGMGMGIDRLVMLLTDMPSIRDVLLFPTMKPTLKQ